MHLKRAQPFVKDLKKFGQGELDLEEDMVPTFRRFRPEYAHL